MFSSSMKVLLCIESINEFRKRKSVKVFVTKRTLEVDFSKHRLRVISKKMRTHRVLLVVIETANALSHELCDQPIENAYTENQVFY